METSRGGMRPVLIHHDNASSHTAAPTMDLLRDSHLEILEHPPNLPDLAPCFFFAFPRLKNALRGIRHANIQDLQAAVCRELKNIPVAHFSEAIDQLLVWWMKCVAAAGEYFEGRNIQIDPEGDHQLVFGSTSSEESSDQDSDHD